MQLLLDRSNNCCELCKLPGELSVYTVTPSHQPNNEIIICATCLNELHKGAQTNGAYWRFLTETMWSEISAVQVMAWRILSLLKNESWAADNLDMLYLDDETLNWAKAGLDDMGTDPVEVHKDSLGAELLNGDTVVLTRSLDVKGSSLNAKMGTVVKNIRLVADNTDQVEGKIEGQQIVILTKYLRKQKN